MHTIVPIHNLGDLLQPGNYPCIMIDHTQAKIVWHSGWYRTQRLQSGCQRDTNPLPSGISKSLLYHQAHHYITLLGKQNKDAKEAIVWMLCRFPEGIWSCIKGMSPIKTSYTQNSNWHDVGNICNFWVSIQKSRCPAGPSEAITITIGLMQGCLLSHTLFGLFITHGFGKEINISGRPSPYSSLCYCIILLNLWISYRFYDIISMPLIIFDKKKT